MKSTESNSSDQIEDLKKEIVKLKQEIKELNADRLHFEERKKTEEEAITRTTELEAILSCIADGVIVYDKQGRIVRITTKKKTEEALLESEEKFSAAFKSNPNAIVLSKKGDGLIVDVNDSFLDLFERSKEEVMGQYSISLDMFANPDDRQNLIDIITNEGRISNYEIKIKRKSGEILTVLLSSEVYYRTEARYSSATRYAGKRNCKWVYRFYSFT